MGGSQVLDQRNGVFGQDNNSDPDLCTFGTIGEDLEVAVETPVMFRVSVANDGTADTGDKNWQLYFNTVNNPATASQVTTSSTGVRMVGGTPADGAACDDEKMAQAETWMNGFYCESDDTAKLTLPQAYNTEFQFCIQLTSGATGPYYLFLRYNDAALDDHTVVLTITATVAAQTVYPSSITSGLAFGTLKVNRTLTPNGIASGLAFGTPTTDITTTPTGIGSAAAFGTPQINLTIKPDGIASGLSFGTPNVMVDQTVEPTGIASTLGIGSPTIDITVTPTGIASTATTGTPQINLTITPTGIASGLAFGSPTVFVDQVVEPDGIASGLAFGNPTVSTAGGTQTVEPDGIASGLTFGTLSIAITVEPTGIASGLSFGTPQVNLGITPDGIASGLVFGVPTVIVAQVVEPTGIASTLAFGTLEIQTGQIVIPTGIVSTLALGTPIVGAWTMGIDHSAALRAFLISQATNQLIALDEKVSTRIYTPRLPPGFKPNVPAISFRRTGGVGAEGPVTGGMYEFRSYGAMTTGDDAHGGEEDAREVEHLLRDALLGDPIDELAQQSALQAVRILAVLQNAEGQDLIDIDGEGNGWPFVMSSYEIWYAST